MGVGFALLAAIALGAGAAALSRTAASLAPPAAHVQAADSSSERKAEPAVDKHGDPKTLLTWEAAAAFHRADK
jgi:hypothetical protein